MSATMPSPMPGWPRITLHLGVVELRRLAQDLLGDADLADVVEQPADLDLA